MIKILGLVFLCFTLLHSASLEGKIKKEKRELKRATSNKTLFSRSLLSIAKEIISTNSKLSSLKNKISRLDSKIKKQKDLETKKNKELKLVKSKVSSLSSIQNSIKTEIADIVIKELSFDIIKSSTNKDINSFISKDIVDILSGSYNQNIKKLQSKFNNITSKIKASKSELNKLQKYISNLEKERKNIFSLKKKQIYLISRLKSKKKIYAKKIRRVKLQEKLLKKTLAKLNILKSKELRKDTLDKQKIANKLSKTKVRHVSSSYKRSIVSSYKGSKARAPLKNYSIKRKFGKYYDPIYKMTTFNDSILMHSLSRNAKVRAMFSGKVIFKNYTKILKNIVVVQSRNGVNVVYANMSKIAPTIKAGSSIKQNYTIGRIESDLSLSVTQNNKYVNPLKVFR